MFNPGPLSIAAAQRLNDLERAVDSLKRGNIAGSFGRVTGPEGQTVYLPPSTTDSSVWVKVTSTTASSGFYPAVLATPLDTTGGTFTDTSEVVSVGFPDSFVPTLNNYYAASLIDETKYEGISGSAATTSVSVVTNVCPQISNPTIVYLTESQFASYVPPDGQVVMKVPDVGNYDYVVGDLMGYQGIVYQCITAYTETGA